MHGVSLINMSPDEFISWHLFSQNQLASAWLTFILVVRSKLYQIDNKNSIASHPITTTHLHPLNTKTGKDKFLTPPYILSLHCHIMHPPPLIVFTPPYILSLLCHIMDPHDCFHTPLHIIIAVSYNTDIHTHTHTHTHTHKTYTKHKNRKRQIFNTPLHFIIALSYNAPP